MEEPKYIILSERSMRKAAYCIIPTLWHSRKGQNYDHQTYTECWHTDRGMDKDDMAQTPHGISRDRQETVTPAAAQTPRDCHTRSDTDKQSTGATRPCGVWLFIWYKCTLFTKQKRHRFSQKQTDGHQRGTAGRTQSGVYHIHTSKY